MPDMDRSIVCSSYMYGFCLFVCLFGIFCFVWCGGEGGGGGMAGLFNICSVG